MARLTLDNLDEDLIRRLEKRAREHDRSLEAEVRNILKKEAPRLTNTEFLGAAERIAAKTRGVAQTDSADLIREDRDSR